MSPDRTSHRAGLFAAAALAFSGLHFATFFDPQLPIFTDIRYFVYFAWRIAEGAIPHLDLFDNKTFGSHFVVALFYRVGGWLGVDGLNAIRASCLAVCAFGGFLTFIVFRRIGKGSQVAGWLALLGDLGFGFIGALTAIGNFPKLFMLGFAMSAALLVLHRRWFLAGLMGALAFMDWQVGALVGVAVVMAALFEGEQRWRASLLALAGGVAGLIPWILYYMWNGALDVAFEQTIMASLARGEESLTTHTVWSRMAKMWRLAGNYCPEQRFLFVNALAGLPLVPIWWWRNRKSDEARLVFPLAAYHYGIIGFSLIDFQRFPDFFLLLQSLAFFLGMTWWLAYQGAARWLLPQGKGSARRRQIVAGVAIVIAILFARPAWLRPAIPIKVGPVGAQTTLAHQQEVARQVEMQTRSKKLVVLGSSELLYLMRYENPLPLIYFNRPALSVYGLPGEDELEAMGRVALSVEPDAVIIPGPRNFSIGRFQQEKPFLPGFRGQVLATKDRVYGVVLYTRVASGAPPLAVPSGDRR